MPINFPDNPTDNQEFNGYIYDATRGVWDVKLASDPLGSLNLTNPAAGEALVFDGTSWKNQKVSSAEAKTITSDSIAVDFSDGIPLEKRTVAGDVTFTGTNYTAGVTKQVLLQGDSIARNITFPAGWNFIGDGVTKIGANKTNLFTINSFGTDEASVFITKSGPNAWEPIVASGGIENTVGNYKIHQFNTSDIFSISSFPEGSEVEVLMVAGGGAGGGRHGGGGGGGGLLSGTITSLTETDYSIFVGAGAPTTVGQTQGANGSDTTFAGFTATGGGGGGAYDNASNLPGLSGGSGGGGGADQSGGSSTQVSYAGLLGFGFSGGAGTAGQENGGGGGAGGVGNPGVANSRGGDGGPGIVSTILGASYYFAGGGGGAGWQQPSGDGGVGGGGGGGAASTSGPAGTGGSGGLNTGGNGVLGNASGDTSGGAGGQNTGGGGGGVGQDAYSSWTGNGGSGGSGIVIIKYPIVDPN